MQELSSLLQSKNILIAGIQESKLKSTKNLPNSFLPNYTAVRIYRPDDTGSGGLITFIHHSVIFIHHHSDSLFPDDSNPEQLSITAIINNIPVNIYNIYISPISSCPSLFPVSTPTLITWQKPLLPIHQI